ncbi:MAG: LamG domain-containing protein, partial [Planctomycetaceae bacterium]|nr:LamG domain-containing protein [Planctomycetaceae bacterium]
MNPALGIPNSTGYLVVDDPGDNSPLDFTSGDNITIEAWISPAKLSGFQYIVGKGRTGRSGFPVENHNYAIRLTATGNLTFLFRSRTKTGEEQYHRWTSTESIMSGDGWHHVAVTYTFGKTKNIQGFIDGQRAYGKWDLGGDTGAPPV